MRKTIWALGVIALAGCGGPGHDPVVSDPHDSWYMKYGNGHPLAAAAESSFVLDREDEIIDLINNHRIAAGLSALVISNSVCDVARAHSIHQAIHAFEGPINPEWDGPSARATHAGLAYWRYDEILSAGMADATDVFNEWVRPYPGNEMHPRIDDPNWDQMGAGYHFDPYSRFGYYWTVDFREL